MFTRNIKRLRYLALFVAILSVGTISSSNASAASTFDTYTDGDGVVWDRETTDGGDIYIGIQSVPNGVTTVTVPAINTVASGKDTYFLDAICSRYSTPDCSGVVSSTANVTKLDMTNTSKIQVKNVSQMFDTNHEVELVFGENMVIADPADIDLSQIGSNSWGGWNASGASRIMGIVNDVYDGYAGAFEGMQVKLTNLNNVKYIGWDAFKNTTLNANSRSVAVSNSQTVGGFVFAGSNIESLSIDATEIGQGFAKGATSLSSLTIGDNVRTIYAGAFQDDAALAQAFDSKGITNIYGSAFQDSGINGVTFGAALTEIGPASFANTSLGVVDFSNSGVEQVDVGAFYDANITSLNMGNIKYAGEAAFAHNKMAELYMPKSFQPYNGGTYGPGPYIFQGTPIKKLTIAFDMLTNELSNCSGTIPNLIGYTAWDSVEEVTFIAPYAANEEVATNHNYAYANVDNYYMTLPNDLLYSLKNVIPRQAFENSPNATYTYKKIIIDDNYEMIGSLAFQKLRISGIYTIKDGVVSENMEFPSKLKVIGSNAFSPAGFIHSASNPGPVIEMETLPDDLEYIGGGAFLYNNNFVLDTLDLPNLKYLGGWAFLWSNVKNIVLHDFAYYGNLVTFMGSDLIETIVVDYDICGDAYLNCGEGFNSMFGNNGVFATEPNQSDGQSKQHYTKIKFTNKAVSMPSTNLYMFQGIYVDELDLSETPWTKLYDGSGDSGIFTGAKIGTLKLPHALETINKYSFMGAEVDNPVEIPNTVKEIGEHAFNADGHESYPSASPSATLNPGVKITSLPTSIEKIGHAAFFMDAAFSADANLPNLEYLGLSAFQGTNVRDVVLGSELTKLGPNAFFDTPSLRNITIDADLYSAERDYDDKTYGWGTSMGYCYMQNGEVCDGTTDEEKMAQRDANFYDSFVATFGTPNHKYGTITFTENAGEPCGGFNNCSKERGYFYGIKADKVDISATNWTATSASMFQDAEVGEVLLPHALETINPWTFYSINAAAATEGSDVEPVSIAIPSTLKEISYEGFMRAQAEIDGLPEGLTTIINSAFYEADVTDELVIPSTVTLIGPSAFNAGSADVTYTNVTIKPDLTMHNSAGQLIFQMFWNAKITNKLIISSSMLPALYLDQQGVDMTDQPEFHGMTMKEAVITNLPKITAQAFEECANLEKVDLSSDSHIRAIEDKAFYNDTKLGTILFSPSIKNEVVTVGPLAFKGTAFKTMGDSTKQFDLTAAKFDASEGYAFSEMPKLETVDVPRTFTNATVPVSTFMNDGELRLATIDYKVTLIDDGAFSEDNKLESIFIWGDTEIVDSTLAGHGASTDGENGIYADPTDQGRGADRGPTIPEGTDIYAYSTSRAEDYAALPVRGTFEGDFYPLDEVLYLTSNKPTVLVNDDATDFDKSDLVVYAMRRDGIILESDEWATYDDNAYPRATSSIDFESMAQAIQDNPVFASIHDTPVPMDELDITTNVNFENIDFAMVPDPDDSTVRKIVLLYNDKYTDNLADTDIIPYQEGGDEPVVPDTGANKVLANLAKTSLPIVAIASLSILAGVVIFKKRRS